MTFIRKVGEKCKVFKLNSFDSDESSDECDLTLDDYPDIKFGDIVYKENGYRALNSYVYANEFLNLSDLYDGNGSGAITLKVTKKIEDPLTFYTKEAISCGDIVEISLSAKFHYDVLKRIAGNRDFDPSIKFIIDCCDENKIKFNSAKLYNGKRHYLELNSELEDCYLQNKKFDEIDPITNKERLKLKENYEKKFDSVIQIGKHIMIDYKTKGSIGGGYITITDIIYKNDNPLECIKIITTSSIGLGWINEEEFIFEPFQEDKIIPLWKCTNLNINVDKTIITISDYNFEK